MNRSLGYKALDVNPDRGTILEITAEAVAQLIDDADTEEVCGTCTLAALVHASVSLLRQAGVPADAVNGIVSNAIEYAESQKSSVSLAGGKVEV